MGTVAQLGTQARTAPAAVMTTNVISTTWTVSHGGRSRHQDGDTGARCTSSAVMSTTGTATKNSQERDTTAIAKARTANGSSTNATSATTLTVERACSRQGGRSTVAGHAVRTKARTSPLRTATSVTASSANVSEDGW